MKRLAALLAAIVMVGLAVVVRGQLDGGGGDSPARPDGPFRLVCATELEPVCDALSSDRDDLDVTVEDPGVTADRLTALSGDEQPGFDGWLNDGPWADIVADNREFGGAQRSGAVLGESSEVLARSPAVIAVAAGRRGELEDGCGGTISWRCVGEQPTGALAVGVPGPDRGDGIAVLAEAAASYFDTTDYSATDFDDPGFSAWFRRLVDLSASRPLGRQTPLARALAAKGTFGLVGSLEAQAGPLLAARDAYQIVMPTPLVTADVTLVAPAGRELDDALDAVDPDRLADALAESGWRVEGRPTADGIDASTPLPEPSGMPAAGVLQRLRELWP